MTSPIRRSSFRSWSVSPLPVAALLVAALLPASLCACGDEDSADTTESTNPAQPAQRLMTWAVSPQDYNETFPGGALPAPMPLSLEIGRAHV